MRHPNLRCCFNRHQRVVYSNDGPTLVSLQTLMVSRDADSESAFQWCIRCCSIHSWAGVQLGHQGHREVAKSLDSPQRLVHHTLAIGYSSN